MFLIDHETEVAVRRGFMTGGIDAAAAVLRSRFLALDTAAATTCALRILSWSPPSEPNTLRPRRKRGKPSPIAERATE